MLYMPWLWETTGPGMWVGVYYRGFWKIRLVASSKHVFSNCWGWHIPVPERPAVLCQVMIVRYLIPMFFFFLIILHFNPLYSHFTFIIHDLSPSVCVHLYLYSVPCTVSLLTKATVDCYCLQTSFSMSLPSHSGLYSNAWLHDNHIWDTYTYIVCS